MKTAIYVRVSTDKQEVDNQLLQLRDYCKKSNYEIYKEYVDIISGKEKSRPGYDKMFEDAHKKLFDLVLFWDLSRFSRAGTLHTLQKLKEFENLGIDWESYQERYLKSIGQFKDVVLSILSTLAKIEREKIGERTKAGLERARKEGKIIGRPKISAYHKKAVLELYKELGSMNAVSKKINISYGSVYSIIKRKEMENG
jgi:DNA invertase Pin-like site-specific DNA recombinase